jgi:hypothetical protein
MKNERRGNQRVAASLDVAVYYNSLVLFDCRTRDISLDGAFVDTQGQSLPQNAKVDLRFDVQVDGGSQQHRLEAEVMHSEDDGVGVKFHYPDFSTFAGVVAMFVTKQ